MGLVSYIKYKNDLIKPRKNEKRRAGKPARRRQN